MRTSDAKDAMGDSRCRLRERKRSLQASATALRCVRCVCIMLEMTAEQQLVHVSVVCFFARSHLPPPSTPLPSPFLAPRPLPRLTKALSIVTPAFCTCPPCLLETHSSGSYRDRHHSRILLPQHHASTIPCSQNSNLHLKNLACTHLQPCRLALSYSHKAWRRVIVLCVGEPVACAREEKARVGEVRRVELQTCGERSHLSAALLRSLAGHLRAHVMIVLSMQVPDPHLDRAYLTGFQLSCLPAPPPRFCDTFLFHYSACSLSSRL
eukprot:1560399-Rhodomonas_salina.2